MLKKIIVTCLFLFLSVTSINLQAQSKSSDYASGSFVKTQSNYSLRGCPLKLRDGRILILGVHENYIYYPEHNTFKAIEPTPYGFSYISNGYTFPAVVLNDGNILIIGNSNNDIYNKLQKELSPLLMEKFKNNIIKTNKYNYLSLLPEEKNMVVVKEYKSFLKLPENDKIKIYMPILKDNPELLKKYNEYKLISEDSKKALIFNPRTENYTQIDKFPVDMRSTSGISPILKQNGDVLLFVGTGEIVLFNHLNKSFSILNDTKQKIYNNLVIQLNSNTLFILTSNKSYKLYDIEKNTYTDEIFFPDEISWSTEYIKLDDEHLVVIGNIKNQKVFIFNPFTKEVKLLTEFSFARSINPDMPIRPVITTDGKLIIFGGFKNEYENNFNMFDTTLKISDNAEIIDIKSGKVKLIKMLYKHAGNRSVILDDGRIIIFGGTNNEVYIPDGK